MKRKGCWFKSLIIIFGIIFIVLISGKLYTDLIVQAAETKYPPSKFVSVENIQLHYHQEGSGNPIVIIHGGNGKVQDFTLSPLYNLAKNTYEVTIFDRPGLGYSQKPADENTTPAVQARLIHGAIETLGIENPVLIGQSWGGVIALTYAQDYPNDISGLVLLGSSPYPREKKLPFFDQIILFPIIGDVILETLYVPIGRHWIAPSVISQNSDFFAPLTKIPQDYYHATLELGLRPSHLRTSADEKVLIPKHLQETANRLEEITVPVMIIAGAEDDHAATIAPQLHDDLPHSEVNIVDDANHFLWFPFPEVVIEAIQKVSEYQIK